MPDTNNSQIRGPPGPPGPRLGGPPKQDGSIWPRGPSGGGGWGNDMPEVHEVSQPTKTDLAKVNKLQSGGDDVSGRHGDQVYIVDYL